ncbi:MAG: universal stress protein [Phenylobacterium sp.]
MSWARVMVPLAGTAGDAAVLSAAVRAAAPFDAEVSAVFAPADVADIMPWLGEGYLGGVQTTAIETLRQAAATGEARSRAAFEACDYAKKTFVPLQSPVWAALSAEARLSDLVVFGDDPARGRGPLAECFQQIVADEQRPVLIAREGFEAAGVVAVAWDGGKEASRAARLALPLLEKAARVVLLAAPKASSRHFEPERLKAYYAARGVQADIEILGEKGEAGGLLLNAVQRVGANLLVAGAFGHPRLQEFIFGGTTRTLLAAQQPSLFLSH